MLRQSHNHTKLPPNWQGHTPDYNRFGAGHRLLTEQLTPDSAPTRTRNQITIARLQSALLLRRQQFAHTHKEI